MKIYYFHSLYLNFNSSQTIQVIRDYRYLSDKGFEITLSGVYDDDSAYQDICHYIAGHNIKIIAASGKSKFSRLLSKLRFLLDVFRHARANKFFVTRSYQKTREALFYKNILPDTYVLMELHEHALPYLVQKKKRVNKLSYEKLFAKVDGLILTNFSQEQVLQDEFSSLPRYAILPNGVETARFSSAQPPSTSTLPIVITYTGQFSSWKNIELIFQAMALLGDGYQLRIAGGKGDAASEDYIHLLAKKYGLSSQLDFRGFVRPDKLADTVLDGSSVLLLPLGDNI